MPVTITLADLRARVRFLGDFDNSRFGQPSQSVSDARLDEVINDSLRATYDLFLTYRGEQFVKEQAGSPSTIAGGNAVTLASDFYRLWQVEVQEGSDYYPLRHINLREAWRFQNSSSQPRGLTFRLLANTLVFYTTPTGNYPLRIWYAPAFAALATTISSFDGINGFERLAIARSVLDLKMREGMPAQEWAAKVQQYTDELRAEAGEADRGTPFMLSGMGGSELMLDWESWR